ncbi:MAG TPA: energy transducer TonB [Blastocatellia bacterium]|nr:energy transducer TonB [Blastocatellia bacterium]HMZ22494.1 energy transducer TonB [Blastocatellia bacterium]
MLPPNFLTIPQIQHERHAGSKLMHLTTLLEYLLKLYNPHVAAADVGKDPKVGERVIACQQVLGDFKNVLWALKVRNAFAHALEGVSYTEREQQNAVNYLIEAIGDMCKQQVIPRALVAAIYSDPDASFHAKQAAEDQRRKEEQARIEREKRVHEEHARKLRAEQERLEEGKRQHARRETEIERKAANRVSIIAGLRTVALLGMAGVGVYFGWPRAQEWIYGSKPTASVVRTQAELALKKVALKKKQTEYGTFVIQANAAWRDAEIEFKKGNYKAAEEKYRQVLSLWDGVNARMAETQSFEELQAEANTLRAAAQKAQAREKAAAQWNQAEELRRNAINARRNGNLEEAKNLILQAQQQYEIAQATAMTPPVDSSEKTDVIVEGGRPEGGPTATPETTPTFAPTVEPARPSPIAQPTIERANPSPSGPGSEGDDDGVFTISEKEFRRYVTKQVPAVASPQAKAAGVSGAVVVTVYLSRQGYISKMWVVEGNMLLRDSALAALRQWNFRPYHLDRVPTDIKSEITIQVR